MKRKHHTHKPGRSRLLWKEHFKTSKKRWKLTKMTKRLAEASRMAGCSLEKFLDAAIKLSNALYVFRKGDNNG